MAFFPLFFLLSLSILVFGTTERRENVENILQLYSCLWHAVSQSLGVRQTSSAIGDLQCTTVCIPNVCGGYLYGLADSYCSVDVHFGDRQWFEHGMSVFSISQPFYAPINDTCYLRYIVKYWEDATWLDSHVGRDNFSHFWFSSMFPEALAYRWLIPQWLLCGPILMATSHFHNALPPLRLCRP